MIAFSIHKKLRAASGDMLLHIDVEIESGKLVTLYGKSGVGKTSLLRILAGLFRPDEGKITVENKVWLDTVNNINLSPQQRKIGFVFQDYALFPNMTVRENLEFALEKGQDPKIIKELIDIIELSALQHRKPNRLSGGQKQRVALARALVQKPKLLILDEPLSALDLEMRIKLQTYIMKVHQAYGLTTILVSHDITEISKMSDEVLVIEEGKVVRRGTVAEIFPNTKVELNGEVVSIERGEDSCKIIVWVGEDKIELSVQNEVAATLSIGDKVMIASELIRPVIKKLDANT